MWSGSSSSPASISGEAETRLRRLLFLLVIGVAGVATLLALGFWQVRRLHWKEGVLAEIAARVDDPLPSLPEAPEEARDEYRLVEVRGRVGAEEFHVLTSRKPEGPGFRVIAALTLEGGRRVLIDRGFVPEAAKGAPRQGGEVALAANLLWPDDATAYTPAPDVDRNIWFAREAGRMAEALGTEPVLLVARSPTGEGISPMPVTIDIANDHQEYAITWFGLAAVWGAMTAYFAWSRRRG
ncbi:MAG TPA: SURF1 family protein [Paracoccaceae bacterium]|nr:SURF1 family protein [Paracoccaceae bacterium]